MEKKNSSKLPYFNASISLYCALRMKGFIMKATMNLLEEKYNYLQTVIDSVNDRIMVIREDYTVEIMNSDLSETIKNIKIADPEHPKCYEISHHRSTPCDKKDFPCPLKIVLNTHKHTTVVQDHYDENGNKRYMELSDVPLFDEEKNCIGVVQTARDISAHLEAQEDLREEKVALSHRAHHDPLTGLPNRALFNDRVEQGIKKSKRHNTKLAIFFIDLDRFKEINDSLGHVAGDEALKVVTQRLSDTIRREDTLGRFGGDEFTIVIEGLHQVQDVSYLAQNILEVLDKPIIVEENRLHISGSIGISFYPEDGDNTYDLLKQADTAMYKAKEMGRNNFQFYSSEMAELVFERTMLESSLRLALKNEEFVIYYQPQVNGKTDSLIGMEGLVRWMSPNMGLVSPEKFMPLLEKTKLIFQLDQWVMKRAMIQIAQWYSQGLNPGVLSLNLSKKQLEQKKFISNLKTMLSKTRCKPEWIELEVTEEQITHNPDNAITILHQLRNIGVKIAVDDFGAGCSSLSHLKRLPIDKLKIDPSFIRSLPEDAVIAKFLIALSRDLHLEVIAEGVETKAQKNFLIKNGCKNIQGYIYGKPMPAEEMESVLLEGFQP